MWFIRDSLGVCNGDFDAVCTALGGKVCRAKVDMGALDPPREPHIEFAVLHDLARRPRAFAALCLDAEPEDLASCLSRQQVLVWLFQVALDDQRHWYFLLGKGVKLLALDPDCARERVVPRSEWRCFVEMHVVVFGQRRKRGYFGKLLQELCVLALRCHCELQLKISIQTL